MNRYLIQGPDPSSDDGRWNVIVEARDRPTAIKKAATHLRKLGREDLTEFPSGIEVTKISPSDDDVIYSTVERR